MTPHPGNPTPNSLSSLAELPQLPYAYDALDRIDARTMEIHHGKHRRLHGQTDAAIDGTDMAGKSIEDLCAQDSGDGAVRNNGGGATTSSGPPGATVAAPRRAIWPRPSTPPSAATTFEMPSLRATRFGSDWAWLCVKDGGGRSFTQPGQPADAGGRMWRHAHSRIRCLGACYYLNYQNRRPDYIAAFFNDD